MTSHFKKNRQWTATCVSGCRLEHTQMFRESDLSASSWNHLMELPSLCMRTLWCTLFSTVDSLLTELPSDILIGSGPGKHLIELCVAGRRAGEPHCTCGNLHKVLWIQPLAFDAVLLPTNLGKSLPLWKSSCWNLHF